MFKMIRDAIGYNGKITTQTYSAGRVTADSDVGWTFGGASWSETPTYDKLVAAYKYVPWAYACVNYTCLAVASLPWVAAREAGENYEEVTNANDRLVMIMDNPNRYMSFYDFIYRHTLHMQVGGETYNLGIGAMDRPVADGGTPAAFWPMDTGKIDPIIDKQTDMLVGFQGVGGKRYSLLEMGQVVIPDPDNYFHGTSPMEAAWSSIKTLMEGNQWLVDLLVEKAQPSHAWKLAKEAATAAYQSSNDEFIKNITRNQTGKHINAGPYEPMKLSYPPVDMGITDVKKDARMEIASAFNTPPMLLGEMEHSTLSNMEQALQQFYKNQVVPTALRIMEGLNRWISQFPAFGDTRLWFDIDNIPELSENANDVVARQSEQINNGIRTINEIRAENGDEPVPGGDEIMVPVGLSPISMITGDPGPGANTGE